MSKHTSSLLYKYGLIFASIPMVVTYLIGHLFKLVSHGLLDPAADKNDPDRIIIPIVQSISPFAILCGILAFVIWILIVKKKPTKRKGLIAGCLTVFLAYPVLGFALGFIYPGEFSLAFGEITRMSSGISNAINLTLIGNILTFWLTYPMGAICGSLIAKHMIAKTDDTAEVFE